MPSPERLPDDHYTFDFGKHEGKRIGDVPASYLEWCIDNLKPLPKKIKEYWIAMSDILEDEIREEEEKRRR